jgi:hypothetical protein
MMETPSDLTAKLARQQLAHCDDYAVFSNYSDPTTKTIKLYEGLEMIVGLDEWGFANLGRTYLKAYQYMITSDLPEKHQWFVKIDPDSFFRVRYLRDILANYSSDEPCALGRQSLGYPTEKLEPRLSGSMEVISHKAFRHNRTNIFLSNMDQDGGEDGLLADGFLKAGFQIHVPQRWDDCSSCYKMGFDYPNLPGKNLSQPHQDWDTSLIPETLEELLSTPGLDCKTVGKIDWYNVTISKDLIVAHPIKDPATYAKLQQLDLKSRIRDLSPL